MAGPRIYLDHLSTTPLLPAAREAMLPFLGEQFGSAGSIHQWGLAARDTIGKSREQFAAFTNAESPESIVFTSSGTEAINLAIKGLTWHPRRKGSHIVCSAIEHPAVLGAIEFLKRDGITSTRVPVDRAGRINPEQVRAAMTEGTFLLATHAANYDIGTIQPLAELGRNANDAGAAFLVEANYAGGWLPLDVQALGIDLLTLAPHRFYGPKGAGVLYRNRRTRLAPLIHGGVQEGGLRAGAENVAAVVGGGIAAETAARELPARTHHVAEMQRRLWAGVRSTIPQVQLNGPEPGPERLVTQLNLSPTGTEGEGLMLMCDAQGIAIGSGTACTLKALKSSPVLEAIGVSAEFAKAAVLISPGKDTTAAEVNQFVAVFAKAVQRLRDMSPGWEEFQKERLAKDGQS
jgi:cysteine desulfurase